MKFRYKLGSEIFELELESSPGGFLARLNGDTKTVRLKAITNEAIQMLLDGERLQAAWAADGEQRWISLNGRSYLLEKLDGRQTRRGSEGQNGGALRAPMPGQVRRVLVSEGEAVKQGQPIILLEAMKMEMRVLAPHDGTVVTMAAQEGAQVEKDDLLAEVK